MLTLFARGSSPAQSTTFDLETPFSLCGVPYNSTTDVLGAAVSCNYAADGSPYTSSTRFKVLDPSANFSSLITFTPPAFDITKSSDLPLGAVVGSLFSHTRLGLFGSACDSLLPVNFTLFNATTDFITNGGVDPSKMIKPLPPGQRFRQRPLAADGNNNGIIDGVEEYPEFALAVSDPDFDQVGLNGVYESPGNFPSIEGTFADISGAFNTVTDLVGPNTELTDTLFVGDLRNATITVTSGVADTEFAVISAHSGTTITVPDFSAPPSGTPTPDTYTVAAVTDLGGGTTTLTDPLFVGNFAGDAAGNMIGMTSGLADGDNRIITDHTGNTITVLDFSAAPSAPDTFRIAGIIGTLDAVTDLGNANTELTDALFTGYLTGRTITMRSGVADTESRAIIGHVGTTITVPDFSAAPGSDDYSIARDDIDGSLLPIEPWARYQGTDGNHDVPEYVSIQFLVFKPGELSAFQALAGGFPGPSNNHPLAQIIDPMGWPSITLLQDPTPVKTAPGGISDFCSGLATVTQLSGVTLDNPCTPVITGALDGVNNLGGANTEVDASEFQAGLTGLPIKMTSGAAKGEIRTIDGQAGTILTVLDFDAEPSPGDSYIVTSVGEPGVCFTFVACDGFPVNTTLGVTADSGTSFSLTDAAAFSPGGFLDQILTIRPETATQEARVIQSNDANTINVFEPFDVAPGAGTEYTVAAEFNCPELAVNVVPSNGGLVVDESGVTRSTTPLANTGILGTNTHLYYAIGGSFRDADNDGIENVLDTCPFTPNPIFDPRAKWGGGTALAGPDRDDDGLADVTSASGTTDSATATVLTDAGNFTPGDVTGLVLTYTNGPALLQSRFITANDANTITVEKPFDPVPTPGGGNTYVVACDPTPLGATGGLVHDGDGFTNRQDNCPLISNNDGTTDINNNSEVREPWPADGGPRGDGIGDACDLDDTVAEGHYHSAISIGAVCMVGGTASAISNEYTSAPVSDSRATWCTETLAAGKLGTVGGGATGPEALAIHFALPFVEGNATPLAPASVSPAQACNDGVDNDGQAPIDTDAECASSYDADGDSIEDSAELRVGSDPRYDCALSGRASEDAGPLAGTHDAWGINLVSPDRGIDTGDVLFALGFVGLSTTSPGYLSRVDIRPPAGGVDTSEVLFILGFVGLSCTVPGSE